MADDTRPEPEVTPSADDPKREFSYRYAPWGLALWVGWWSAEVMINVGLPWGVQGASLESYIEYVADGRFGRFVVTALLALAASAAFSRVEPDRSEGDS